MLRIYLVILFIPCLVFADFFADNDINLMFGGWSKHFNSDGPRNENNTFFGVDYVAKRTKDTIHSVELIHTYNSFWESTDFYGYGWRKYEQIDKNQLFSYGTAIGLINGYKKTPRLLQQKNGFAPALMPNIRYTYKLLTTQVSMLGPDATAIHFLIQLN